MTLWLVVALWGTMPAPVRGGEPYAGMTLAEALQALQAEGLRLVFSSKIVTADMRVATEPTAETPRALLEALLHAHGLSALAGPGGVLQVVRAPRAVTPRGSTRPRRTGTVEGRVTDARDRRAAGRGRRGGERDGCVGPH